MVTLVFTLSIQFWHFPSFRRRHQKVVVDSQRLSRAGSVCVARPASGDQGWAGQETGSGFKADHTDRIEVASFRTERRRETFGRLLGRSLSESKTAETQYGIVDEAESSGQIGLGVEEHHVLFCKEVEQLNKPLYYSTFTFAAFWSIRF